MFSGARSLHLRLRCRRPGWRLQPGGEQPLAAALQPTGSGHHHASGSLVWVLDQAQAAQPAAAEAGVGWWELLVQVLTTPAAAVAG